MIDLTQEDLKTLLTILESVSYKLSGAKATIPVADKIRAALVPEPSGPQSEIASATTATTVSPSHNDSPTVTSA